MANLFTLLRYFRSRKNLYYANVIEISHYILAWIIGLLTYSLVIMLTMKELNVNGTFNFIEWIAFSLSTGFILGSLNGLMEVFLFRHLFKKTKFVFMVINKTLLFVLLFIITVILYHVFNKVVLIPLNISGVQTDYDLVEIFQSSEIQKHLVIAMIVNFGINFFMIIKKKMGKGVLLNLFLGKYHHPRSEQRVVMFLDLTSSSAIAEKLDPYKYSELLKDFFFDIDEAINKSKGAIYQFVGDEVVIIWEVKEGCEKNNCLRFYFDAERKIEKEKEKYLSKYGLVPQFKAGGHYGNVIITEVGASKQEIAYHGDTVNTAARIRSTCNSTGKKLLISAELISILQDLDPEYKMESVGIQSFKGKENVLALFSVERR